MRYQYSRLRGYVVAPSQRDALDRSGSPQTTRQYTWKRQKIFFFKFEKLWEFCKSVFFLFQTNRSYLTFIHSFIQYCICVCTVVVQLGYYQGYYRCAYPLWQMQRHGSLAIVSPCSSSSKQIEHSPESLDRTSSERDKEHRFTLRQEALLASNHSSVNPA